MKTLWGIDPGDGYHAHHVFPQALEALFNKSGIKIHSPAFGGGWEAGDHLANAGKYENAWRGFFDKYKASGKIPSRSQIISFGRELWGVYDFHW